MKIFFIVVRLNEINGLVDTGRLNHLSQTYMEQGIKKWETFNVSCQDAELPYCATGLESP